VKILRSPAGSASPIGARPFAVERVSSVEIAAGDGEAHAYVLHFEAGGLIDRHEAGFGQLFFALSGDGWVAGEDGVRQSLREGEAAFIARGEAHAKGSDSGLTALMFQVRDLDPLIDGR
jgi:quercetin dioxygenase-like cupin family protein